MLVKHAIIRTCALTPDQRNAVDALIDRSTQADGVSPLNEAASLGLQGRGHVMHWLAYEQGALVGYAQADRDTHSVQLVVSPKIRRQGVGTALAEAVQQVEKEPNWWAFDNGDGARALADRIGATLDRELLIMERDLVEHPVDDEPTPEGVELSAFVPTDAMAVVDVNADAFAEHPEQGDMTLDDFQVRTQEPWFDPEGLIVARDQLPTALSAISDVLPLSYAVDAMSAVAAQADPLPDAGLDLLVIAAWIAAALLLGSLTLRRRTP